MVLEQFPDRFYHSPHLQPTLHTKLRLDEEKLKAGGGGGGGKPPRLTEEDRKLEERFRKLKESHVPTTPASSETALHERLAKLREEPKNNSKNGSGETNESSPLLIGNQPSNKTEAEQANDLVDQVSDIVKLDAKVNPSGQQGSQLNLEDSVNTFLSGLEIPIEDEDPNKLLEDFKKFQSKEEHRALAEATSCEVQAVVEKAKELQQDGLGEGGSVTFITPYPQLPDSVETQVLEEDKISQVEIKKVMEAAQKEMEQEEKERKDIDQFISEASKQLGELRGTGHSDTESDCEVRSKLEHRQDLEPQHRLDFSWDHFGGSGCLSSRERSTDSGLEETAARQLGITLSGSSGRLDSDDEVAGLIEQTMAEVALDHNLEEKGLNAYLDVPGKPAISSKSSEKGGATASGVGGACAAATNYPMTSGWEAGPDDLPWCCICNSDAHIRCFDCDNDLYCTQCFSEGHEQFGLFDHKYAPFDPSSSRVM